MLISCRLHSLLLVLNDMQHAGCCLADGANIITRGVGPTGVLSRNASGKGFRLDLSIAYL